MANEISSFIPEINPTINCERKDWGGTLVVNKEKSAALGMIRIFANLLANGLKPSIYCQFKTKMILKGKATA